MAILAMDSLEPPLEIAGAVEAEGPPTVPSGLALPSRPTIIQEAVIRTPGHTRRLAPYTPLPDRLGGDPREATRPLGIRILVEAVSWLRGARLGPRLTARLARGPLSEGPSPTLT